EAPVQTCDIGQERHPVATLFIWGSERISTDLQSITVIGSVSIDKVRTTNADEMRNPTCSGRLRLDLLDLAQIRSKSDNGVFVGKRSGTEGKTFGNAREGQF